MKKISSTLNKIVFYIIKWASRFKYHVITKLLQRIPSINYRSNPIWLTVVSFNYVMVTTPSHDIRHDAAMNLGLGLNVKESSYILKLNKMPR